jgi:ATP-binding cassette, subfamily B, putative efflux pump
VGVLRPIWRRYRRRVAAGVPLIAINRAAALVLPFLSRRLMNDVIHGHRWELLPWFAAIVGFASVVEAATAFAAARHFGLLAQHAITATRRDVLRHVLRLPVRRFDATHSGALVSRIVNDADGLRDLIGSGFVQLVSAAMTAAAALVVLLTLHGPMTAVALAVYAAYSGGMSAALQRLRPLFRERLQMTAEITARLAGVLGGARLVKIYGMERREARAFAKDAHRLLRNLVRSLAAGSVLRAGATATIATIGIIVMIMGASAVRRGAMTPGDLVLYVVLLGVMGRPVEQLTASLTQIPQAIAGLERLAELRRLPVEDADQASREPLPWIAGEVAFDAVSFQYNSGTPVLKDISFVAPPGTTTAIVGSSGAGKSTLLSLVAAFDRPTAGRVLVDGQDLARVRLRDYRSHLGVVLQDDFLFDGTIAENIALSRREASRADIEAAGALAACTEFVDRCPAGYDTIVGERGVKLSGGQRQRVAIARAILADPTILVLDEATASLDSEHEWLIQDALRSLRAGRTTFVIAHRLSTIESADQILVLESGRIVERGPHRALLARGGRYRDLYDRQNAGVMVHS